MPVTLAVFLTACIGVIIALLIALGGSFLPEGRALQLSVYGIAVGVGVASAITGIIAILAQIWSDVV